MSNKLLDLKHDIQRKMESLSEDIEDLLTEAHEAGVEEGSDSTADEMQGEIDSLKEMLEAAQRAAENGEEV